MYVVEGRGKEGNLRNGDVEEHGGHCHRDDTQDCLELLHLGNSAKPPRVDGCGGGGL